MNPNNDRALVLDQLPKARPGATAAPSEQKLTRALEEYLAALDGGQKPDRQTFLAQHADIADQLADCLDGLEFVYTTAPLLQEPAEPRQEAPPSPPAVASRVAALGDFRIVREVGRGGMGVVYEAEQLSLGRRVALKVLPFAATLDPKQLQRFKSEAHAAACLHHTNIVPVFAVGCERGVHYYAMQFIEGQTLAEAIKGLRQLAGIDPVDPSCVTKVRPELAASLGSSLPEPASPFVGESRGPVGGTYVENTPLNAKESPSTLSLPHKIQTYVVQQNNIWSGSAFRNICPTAISRVEGGRT